MPTTPSTELEALSRRYRSALMAFFMRRAASHADAEDLTQEVFVRISRNYGHADGNLEGLVFEIAANLLRDKARREKTRQTLLSNIVNFGTPTADTHDPGRLLLGREQLSKTARYLDELPEQTRNIYILFRIEGLEQAELANTYGISVRAIQKHVAKALAHLHSRFEAEDK